MSLSIGSVAGLGGVLVALFIQRLGLPIWLSVALTLGVALLIGLISTWLDNAKAKFLIGWRPRYDLERLIEVVPGLGAGASGQGPRSGRDGDQGAGLVAPAAGPRAQRCLRVGMESSSRRV